MKKFTLVHILCIFFTALQAQVQFVSVGNNFSGSSSLKVASFKSDGTSALLHDFKVTDPTDCNGVITGPGGKLYGTTLTGGAYENGTLFSVNPDGTNFKIIYHYKKAATAVPPAVSPDGRLYIVISDSLYIISPDESALTFINKVAPSCKRIVISEDQWVYGCGSANDSGMIFRIKTDGSAYSILHVFDFLTDGFLDFERSLVCITPTGRIFLTCIGSVNSGQLFSMRTDGSDFKVNRAFTADDQDIGIYPLTAGAVLYNKGKIIFTMYEGGEYYQGTIVSFDTLTSAMTKIFSFPSGYTGTHPQIINGRFVGFTLKGLYSVAIDGTGYQQINSLPLSGYPILNYDPSTNKIFYVTNGGAFKNTQLIKIDAVTSTNSTIHSFGNVPQGYNPDGIIRTPNGVLYGIAHNGGSEGGGTIFKMNADGSAFSVVKDFAGNNGQSPEGRLLYASDGRLYGVCKKSGVSGTSDSMLIYGMDVNGTNYLVLHISDTKTDGTLIPELTESSSGDIAGVIGPLDELPPPGKIFKLRKNGTGFTILKTLSSTGADGWARRHGLVFYNSYFYGVNLHGGSGGANGLIFRVKEDGSDYSVVKYFYSESTEGSYPQGGLTLGSDNKLYGITRGGGSNYLGTVFALNPSDLSFQVIYNSEFTNGIASLGKFIEASDGKLYAPLVNGIFGINRDGSDPVLISSPDYIARQSGNGSTYLTEIPVPVTIEFCPPFASTGLNAGINATNYQWQLNTGTGFVNITDNSNYNGTNSDSLGLYASSSFTGYQYRCLADGVPGKTYILKFTNSWKGTLNNNWENPANWSCGTIPDSNTDVVINSGTVVVNSNVSIRSLKVETGVNFTVNDGFVLSITH